MATAALEDAFRTTLEVDIDQAVVRRGPYWFVRHPSYTGVIAMTTGFRVLAATWPTFSIAVVCPTVVILRRIRVEEPVFADTLGEPFANAPSGLLAAPARRLVRSSKPHDGPAPAT